MRDRDNAGNMPPLPGVFPDYQTRLAIVKQLLIGTFSKALYEARKDRLDGFEVWEGFRSTPGPKQGLERLERFHAIRNVCAEIREWDEALRPAAVDCRE
jgi:hypothetical protein